MDRVTGVVIKAASCWRVYVSEAFEHDSTPLHVACHSILRVTDVACRVKSWWVLQLQHQPQANACNYALDQQVLGRHQRGLGKLLEVYCNVATDKSFQKSDWRIR